MSKKTKLTVVVTLLILISLIFSFVAFTTKKSQPALEQNEQQTQSNNSQEWETFTHPLGYSFKYPENLETILLETEKTVTLRSTESVPVGGDFYFDSHVYTHTNENSLSLKEFIEDKEGIVDGKIPSSAEYTGTPFIREVISFEKKDIDGKQAYFLHADPCSICRGETYKTYIELSPDTILSFDIFVDAQTGNRESYKLYNEILSTFEFQD